MSTNWKKELEEAIKEADDKLEKLCIKEYLGICEPEFEPKYAEITDPIFTREFYDGYGGSNGCHFTAWGEKRVYFPAVYDGSEWVDSVPRNPCLIATQHIGGQ